MEKYCEYITAIVGGLAGWFVGTFKTHGQHTS